MAEDPFSQEIIDAHGISKKIDRHVKVTTFLVLLGVFGLFLLCVNYFVFEEFMSPEESMNSLAWYMIILLFVMAYLRGIHQSVGDLQERLSNIYYANKPDSEDNHSEI